MLRACTLAAAMALVASGCRSRPPESVQSVAPVAHYAVSELVKDQPIFTNVIVPLDPVYKKEKRYRGVASAPIFSAIAKTNGGDALLVFRCMDGYSPVRHAAPLAREKGFIAVEDASQAPGSWEPFANGETPAPYYLVWPDHPHSNELPWPYQLISIDVYNQKALDLDGDSSDQFVKGRDLFFQNCITCHRIRGVGGTVGPELIVPHKVTEYWNHKFLRQFIQNPPSIRATAKMPVLGLNKYQASQIVYFLEKL
jgi:mono/diheme cytochrome c family protein